MRVACVGGGPGGLFLAALLKRGDPSIEVTVFERNRPADAFGFGVVFSDATLGVLDEADPELLYRLDEHGRRWDRIEVRLKGERIRCGGNGMVAITRKVLLQLLQQRAAEAGVELRFGAEVRRVAALDDYDVVVAADGANSRIREEMSEHLEPEVQVATAKFIWFGTTYLFDGLTFVHVRGPHGAFAVHGYPISRDASTFIVETDEASWRAAGLDEFDVTQPSGASDEASRRYLESLFAAQIDGHRLLTNNSRWGNFRTRRMRRWRHGNVVFLGDAAHTAHFSVGSGTKMAMEDAAVLARTLLRHGTDLDTAFEKYEAERRPAVEHIQNAARPSLSWWEHFGRYLDAFEPAQFAFHFLSRSIGRDKLARRDTAFVASVEQDWAARHGGNRVLDAPLQAAGHSFPGRLLNGTPDDDWLIRVAAPDDEDGLPQAVEGIRAAAALGSVLVAVHSGTALTRTLLAEEARIGLGLPALLVEPDGDEDRARTLVLSGRADLVALS